MAFKKKRLKANSPSRIRPPLDFADMDDKSRAKEIARLTRENAMLTQENEILRKFAEFVAEENKECSGVTSN